MERYTVANKSGERVNVSRDEYVRMIGDRTTRAYIAKVYTGRMMLEEVSEELREEVASAVAARTEFSREYKLSDKTVAETLIGGNKA